MDRGGLGTFSLWREDGAAPPWTPPLPAAACENWLPRKGEEAGGCQALGPSNCQTEQKGR